MASLMARRKDRTRRTSTAFDSRKRSGKGCSRFARRGAKSKSTPSPWERALSAPSRPLYALGRSVLAPSPFRLVHLGHFSSAFTLWLANMSLICAFGSFFVSVLHHLLPCLLRFQPYPSSCHVLRQSPTFKKIAEIKNHPPDHEVWTYKAK